MTSAELDLNEGPAARVALALEVRVPGVVFTSGRRDVAAQAANMAANCVAQGGGGEWIRRTYVGSVPSAEAASMADAHPNASAAELTTWLLQVLNQLDDEELRELSWHCSGDAFDVQPGTCPLELLQQLVDEELAGGARGKLLQQEGGLVRWHVQLC